MKDWIHSPSKVPGYATGTDEEGHRMNDGKEDTKRDRDGLGKHGGKRPDEWRWKQGENAGNERRACSAEAAWVPGRN